MGKMIYVGDTLYFQVALSNKLANYSSIYWSFCAFFFWSPWIGCLLYFYNSRGAFQLDSSNPVSSRPLDISGFVVSGISVESPYTITLSPVDREDVRQSFELLCDTIHEMREWSKALIQEGKGEKDTSKQWGWQVVE